MTSAKQQVLARFPGARVVRGIFGLIVITSDHEDRTHLGDGRAYYEEEAWVSAILDSKCER